MMHDCRAEYACQITRSRPAGRDAAAIGRGRAAEVIMCHGVFDLVHPGHIRHLLYAKSKADVLVASLTADAHIPRRNFRPFVPQELRALNLAALEMVDYVIIDKDPTPIDNIALIQPDYFAKGYEYQATGPASRSRRKRCDAVEGYGGEMHLHARRHRLFVVRHHRIEPPDIAIEKLLTLMEAEGLSSRHLRSILDKFAGVRVHVVGDTIVDSLDPYDDDRRHDQDADHERAVRRPPGFHRRRGDCRQAPRRGGRRGHILDRARRRPARGIRAQRARGRRRQLHADSSTARGRRPTRTPSSPAVTIC